MLTASRAIRDSASARSLPKFLPHAPAFRMSRLIGVGSAIASRFQLAGEWCFRLTQRIPRPLMPNRMLSAIALSHPGGHTGYHEFHNCRNQGCLKRYDTPTPNRDTLRRSWQLNAICVVTVCIEVDNVSRPLAVQ